MNSFDTPSRPIRMLAVATLFSALGLLAGLVAGIFLGNELVCGAVGAGVGALLGLGFEVFENGKIPRSSE